METLCNNFWKTKIILLFSFFLFSVEIGFTQSVTASNKAYFSNVSVTDCGNNIWKVKAYQANQWAAGELYINYGGTIIGSCAVNSGCWNNSLKYTTNQSWSATNDGSFSMSGHAGRWVYIEVNTSAKTANTQSTDFTCSSCTQPTEPTSITGTTSICSGGTTILTATGGSSGSGATFQWGTGTVVGSGTIVQNTTSASYTTPTLTSNQSYWVRRIGTSTGCTNTTGGVSTTITVSPTSVGGSISGGTTPICQGLGTGTMTLSGHTGTIVQWQKRLNSGAWSNITNTNTTYSETPTSAGTWEYRAEVKSGTCASVYSSTRSIVVNPISVAGSISGATTVCSGSNSGTLTLSGHTGNIVKWQSSTNGGSTWSDISNTTTTQAYTNLTSTTQYRAVVQSGSCSSAITSSVSITVSPTSVGGTANAGTATICSGSSTTVSVSGHTGTIQWQQSADGSTGWANVSGGSGATTSSYTTPNLTSTTYYRAVITSGVCSASNSTTATVTVSPTTVAGSISGATSVCSGVNSGTLTLSGHTGSIVKWQSSINGGLNWSDISNTTTSQVYSNLNTTTQYRAVVQSGSCSSVTTSPVTITVSPTTVAGTLSGIATVCYGDNSGTVTLSGNTGNVVKWQSSSDGGSTWSDISNTTTTQSYTNLTSTTQYRAVVQSGVCSVGNTSAITITVYSDLIAGSISGNQTICSGVVPDSILSVSLPTGGTGSYTYQWQSSSDNSTWSNVGGATLKDYLPGALVSNTYFRRAVTSGSCGTVYSSNFIKVNTCSGPGGVASDVTLWLKADAGITGSDSITIWEDMSGNEKHATRSLGKPSKTSVSKNYNPSVSFDGNSGFNTDSVMIEHMFIVVQPNEGVSTSNEFQIIGRKNHNSSSKARVFGFGNKTIRYSSDSSTFATPDRIRINGKTNVSLATTKANVISVDSENKGRVKDVYKLGEKSSGTSYNNLNGKISEIICFASKKSGVDLAKIESYLSIKYGITISNEGGGTNGNYYNSNGDLIWDANDNSTYHNDVIAIGKDNAQFLNQKQSKTNDDNLKVFMSSLVSSNALNVGVISNDRSFIVIGHNNGILKSDSTIDLESPSEIKHRLAREWKITNTNFDDNFALEIEWDSSGTFDLSHVRLLVDDDGDFTNADVYGPADGLNFRLGSIIVENINSSFIPKGSTKYVTLGSIDDLTVLPISLLSFYGTKNNTTVDLNWETASEINSDYFEILHSTDGINFISIGKVNAANYSTVALQYQLTHYMPINGVNYYKLREYDLDGKSYDYKMINVEFDFIDVNYDFIVYPNPVYNSGNIYLKTNYFGDIQIYLFDINGKLVKSKYITISNQEFILLNNLNLEPGVYTLVINSPNNLFINKTYKKIIK
jgi:hypothetical protein